ncbi:MAG: DoxX family protein [Flavitalea sp.]
MKKFLSISYGAPAFNVALLLLRVGAGALLMIAHGYDKLVHFAQYQKVFMNFMGIGSSFSLGLAVFAEFFCSIFIIVGLFTRLVSIPIIILLSTALFKSNNAEIFGKGELSALFLVCFITILLVGPGKISVDGMINK